MSSKYLKLGVSADKPEVHAALAVLESSAAPGAFCQVVEAGNGMISAIHADGAGTKSIAAYLHYRETGDPAPFEGIAVDSAVMNIDDLLCIGATTGFLLSNTIGRNAQLVRGDVLKALLKGYRDFSDRMRPLGVSVQLCGGETADIGDLVRTIVVDSTVYVSIDRKQFIDAQDIAPSQAIVGLASFGQATYEDRENSGIGSNGLTVARHVLLSDYYAAKYPETYSPLLPAAEAYAGKFRLDDPLPGTNLSVGSALLSPTRSYAPLMHEIFRKMRASISGVLHCSGGALTKCLRFGRGIHYVKDNLFPLPPLFRTIQEAGELPHREMWNVFNCGHRMEIICDPGVVDDIVSMASAFKIQARQIGRTERAAGAKNSLTILDGGVEQSY